MNTISNQKQKASRGFSDRLLEWYSAKARDLPWRIPPFEHAQGVRQNPYKVWLSEVMLQQTQVATVREYYLKFLEKWPTVFELAEADLEDVLKAWAGLGYYSRARNLKKCADTVADIHGGKFPSTVEDLRKLPGIGEYTACAIASIAFDRAVPVMDGNVERVIARHRRIDSAFPAAKPIVKSVLLEILDQETPGEFAQAMMDLGATICTPKKTSCNHCPVNADCQAFAQGDPHLFPKKLPKIEKPTRRGAAFVIQNSQGSILLGKRETKGLLAGMTEVPTTNWSAAKDGEQGAGSVPFPSEWQRLGTIQHTFTHFRLELEVWYTIGLDDVQINGWWCKPEDLAGEALPTVMKKVLAKALQKTDVRL